MELAKTDYENETEARLCSGEDTAREMLREMLERRDAEITRLHTELNTLQTDLETLHTVNSENALMLDDIRLPLFKLLKDQMGAMVSGEIAEQLKTKETAFDIQDHMDEIREDITYNFDISSFQSEIEEIVTERDITDEVNEIVEDCLRGAKITIG